MNGSETLVAVDSTRSAIIHIQNPLSNNITISVLGNSWSGDNLVNPSNLYLDTDTDYPNNLYVVDCNNNRIVLFFAMQTTSPLPQNIAGVRGSNGYELERFTGPYGMTLDSKKNLYVADSYNHRIMFWPVNGTSGTILVAPQGSGPGEVNAPYAVFLDETKGILYVADKDNHRIQSYNINDNAPFNGTTVAGGNGAGAGSQQLNCPSDVWISPTTGAMYIVDSNNHRIQRWILGASSGVTIAGDPTGYPGSELYRMSTPFAIAINDNETRMYVAEIGNKRIGYFSLT